MKLTNPFISVTFSSIWCSYFQKKQYGFSAFKSLTFYKKCARCYINVGRNLTKGISYELDDSSYDFKDNVFLIYDVPGYFKIKNSISNKDLGVFKVKQYPGFLIQLDKYASIEEYLRDSFGKSTRYKLKKYRKRLEHSFDISSKMFLGDVDKLTYDQIFEDFKKLLVKRFGQKKVRNNNLETDEWNFYKEVAYPLILEKKAGLFVVYNGDSPIAITLNYFSKNVLFDAITVFDIDYGKFHLGSTNIMKLIEWCMENKLHTLDFSKGYFDYKKQWSNLKYTFEMHIYYYKRSIFSIALAFLLRLYFSTKQFLRDKNVNLWFSKLLFHLKNKNSRKLKTPAFEFKETNNDSILGIISELNRSSDEFNLLKKAFFEFLYLYQEKFNDVKIYSMTSKSEYLFIGEKKQVMVTVINNQQMQ